MKTELIEKTIYTILGQYDYTQGRLTLGWIKENTGIAYKTLRELGMKDVIEQLNNTHYLPLQYAKMKEKRRIRFKNITPEAYAKKLQTTKEWYDKNRKKPATK